MYLDRVSLTNIRGFKNLEFSFDRGGGKYAGWTVFTGDNGSGKSTLLKAISVALTGKEIARALEPSFDGWIRGDSHEASISVEVVRVNEDDSLTQQGKPPVGPFPARLALRNGSRKTSIEVEPPAGRPANYQTPQRTLWAPEAHGWFSCGYGPFRRVFGASPEATRQMVSPTTERFVTMFQEAASLAEVDQWLRNLHHKKLEGRDAETHQLDLVLKILGDELMPNQMTVDRIDSDGLWLKDRTGLSLAWREMSDGYRAALALLADILRHLIKEFGVEGLVEADADGRLAVKRSGVVLIDEIDAHLHPEWQRVIGFWLKRHFPRMQFLVTSHSPLICQAADPNGIFVLPEPGSDDPPRAVAPNEYEKIIYARPDTILRSSAFGLPNTRSEMAVEARAEFAKLRAKARAKVKLSKEEAERMGQLKLVFSAEEDSEVL